MSKLISTVDELAYEWGGTGALAEWLDVVPSAVSNWRKDDSIPAGYHLRLYLEAQARGLKLSPKLFGFDKWPAHWAKSMRVEAEARA